MLDYKNFAEKHLQPFETFMLAYVDDMAMPVNLKESMLYSVRAGGKRIRPMLLLATLASYGKDPSVGFSAASAVEFIHTYSLIHDDLPCMDDDGLRRGKPTNHIVFGDGLATLAGDALQSVAYQVIAECDTYSATDKVDLLAELAKAAGPLGMVGGQVADMEAENQLVHIEQLEQVHLWKTGKLMEYSLLAGAILAGAGASDIAKLRTFAKHLGLAFQIQDDILDIEGHEAMIGKPVGSDVDNNKSTYPAILTLVGAKKKLAHHTEMAIQVLDQIHFDGSLLKEIVIMQANRKK